MQSSRSTNGRLDRATFLKRGADYFEMTGRGEFVAVLVLFASVVFLTVWSVLHQGFDSDEPQYLHVIWAWTHGFRPYRDVFDNHMPLFQILNVPIVRLLGERATIIHWMRFVLLPLYFVSAWCIYRIGTLLFTRRAGVWAVILVAFYKTYHVTAIEFRTDNLWAALWLLCLVVLLGGPVNIRRALVAGVFLGLCFGVSMKSALLLVALVTSAVAILAMAGPEKEGASWLHLLRCSATFVTTALLIPAAIMIFVAANGLWSDFRYDVFDFNLLGTRLYEKHAAWGIAAIFLAVLYAGRRLIRYSIPPELARRRAFLLILCGSYLFFLETFWASITHQDFLPFLPLAFVLVSGELLGLSDRLARRLQFETFKSFPPLPSLPSWNSVT